MREKIANALKESIKVKEQKRVSTIRLILAALKDRDIAAREDETKEGISDEEILQLLQKLVKQRHASIEAYEKAERHDLASEEKYEIEIIRDFLPRALAGEEIEAAVEMAIREVDARSIKDMGMLMSFLREKYPGQIDFGKATAILKQQLIKDRES